jgi:hypothetical protein
MSLEERADLIYNNVSGNSNRDYAIGYAERHLREAVEEAVREDRKLPVRFSAVSEATNYNDPCNTTPSNQPTAADALKAVERLCRWLEINQIKITSVKQR